MLQASEYSPKEYLKWFWRVKDFSKVEYRKQLDLTLKAKLILATAWIVVVAQLIGVVLVVIIADSISGWLIAVGWFMLIPVLTAYILVLKLYFGELLLQKPRERSILNLAQSTFNGFEGSKIVILGSYGKTSLKEMLRTVLGNQLNVKFTSGNLNTPLGLAEFAQTIEGDEDILIIELGEFKPGDIAEFAQLVEPSAAIITGLNEAHLDSFGTLEASAKNLLSISDFVDSNNLFINFTSPKLKDFARSLKANSYTDKKVLGWTISNVLSTTQGTSFSMKKNRRTLNIETRLLGKHNIPALALTCAIADIYGLTKQQIEEAVKLTSAYEHRFFPYELGGAFIIDDTYNGNIDGFKAGIEFVSQQSDFQRKVYITPGLVELGTAKVDIHKDIGRMAAKVFDVIVLMKNSNTDAIKKGLKKAKYKGELIEIQDPLDFYNKLDNFVAKGDIVLMQNDFTDNYV
jgi:UDP-N-acetylmuramoyl-tripeptide--D-alanyl-D-alanine ligase